MYKREPSVTRIGITEFFSGGLTNKKKKYVSYGKLLFLIDSLGLSAGLYDKYINIFAFLSSF